MLSIPYMHMPIRKGNGSTQLTIITNKLHPPCRLLFGARRLQGDCEDSCQDAYEEDIKTCMMQGQMVPMTTPKPKLACKIINGKEMCTETISRAVVVEEPRSDEAFRYWCENNCKSCKENLRDCLDNCKPDPQVCRDACYKKYRKGSYGLWSCFENCSDK
jgi:hypothetical protein